MAKPVEILLGVTGSIAAYKSLELLRLFRKKGWNVTVVLTRAAAKLTGIDTFRALSGREVGVDLFPKYRIPHNSIHHIDLAVQPDLTVIAPATANIIGKLAHGIADDLLSTILLAIPSEKVGSGRVLIAPAMNSNMWSNPIVQENIRRLAAFGYRFINPETGELACGMVGTGRMASPESILETCCACLTRLPDFTGVRVLVTTGRTEEPLDPVRVITNRSSGIMGLEIAKAFKAAGSTVTLIAGEVTVQLPPDTIRVRTAAEMATAVENKLPETDILVMCAAVADYQPVKTARAKLHAPSLTVAFRRTPDILKIVSASKYRPFTVAFSQDDSVEMARKKLREKKPALIVANPVQTAGSATIRPVIIYRSSKTRRLQEMSKVDFARELVKIVGTIYHRNKKGNTNHVHPL
ncbi:MAG: bifunctional phosphopantothenoylcysteine decarboxylase/phosphopantothenate--cysteine ligase CoaBC [candidate division WOR-3 bacterium]